MKGKAKGDLVTYDNGAFETLNKIKKYKLIQPLYYHNHCIIIES